MKKAAFALALLALSLPFGCKGEDPPDPLAEPDGFCDAWADAACQDKVVEYCNAKSAAACKATQSSLCLDNLPPRYSSKHAQVCLDAVKAAYADGDLSADDIAVVLHFAAPCDQLSAGVVKEGQTCSGPNDCATADGLTCIIKGGDTAGTCAIAEEVGGGEACDGDTQTCAEGFYCNGENCISYKKTGATCDGDYQCKPEDHCTEMTDSSGSSCQPRLDLNEACADDNDCQSHYCAVATGDTEGECVKTVRLSRTEPLCANLR